MFKNRFISKRRLSTYSALLLVVWFAQLIVRITMAIYASRNNTLIGDQSGYNALGNHFLEYLVHGNCERLPLYPFFLSFISTLRDIFGFSKRDGVLVVLLIQHGMMMFSIHLISKLVARFTARKRLGYFISLVVFSLYYPTLLSPNGLLTESFYIFLLTVPTYLLSMALAVQSPMSLRKTYSVYLTAGFLFGCSALVRPNILPFPFLVSLVLLVTKRRAYRQSAAFLVAFCLTMAPWMIRNYVIYGQFAYTSVSGKNLYSANKFKEPLTPTGRIFEKRYGRPAQDLRKKKLGGMQNNLKGFLKRDDVYRNAVFLDAALQHIKWHSNVEFAAFYKEKLDRFLRALFQGATVEYHYANVSFSIPPTYLHNLYHVLLIVLGLSFFLGKSRNIVPAEGIILMQVLYSVALFLLAPVCPRMLLPSVFFFLYFAIKRIVALPFIKDIAFADCKDVETEGKD